MDCNIHFAVKIEASSKKIQSSYDDKVFYTHSIIVTDKNGLQDAIKIFSEEPLTIIQDVTP